MASIRKRTKKDGSTSFMVCWRDPANRQEQGITLPTESEAITLKRLLDAIVADTIGPDLRFGTSVYQRMSLAPVVAPDAEVRAGLEAPVAAEGATQAYTVTSKGPVVVPPFGSVAGHEMSY